MMQDGSIDMIETFCTIGMSLELWMLTYKYMLIMHAQLLLGKIYKVQSKGMGSFELKLICVIGLVFKSF